MSGSACLLPSSKAKESRGSVALEGLCEVLSEWYIHNALLLQGPSGRARDASDIRSVIDSGFNILTPDGHATYGALQKVFPGTYLPQHCEAGFVELHLAWNNGVGKDSICNALVETA